MPIRDYAIVYAEQHGRCALCGAIKPPAGKDALVVDTDPDLGGIRSLLCMVCRGISISEYMGRSRIISDALNSGYRCDGTHPFVRYYKTGKNKDRAIVRHTLTDTYMYRTEGDRVKRPYIGVDGKEHIRKGV